MTDRLPGTVRNQPYTMDQFQAAFWAKVEKSDGCWLWTGTRGASGYGQHGTRRLGRKRAHRTAYEWLVGPIPEGLELDHLCRTPACVNPAHLEPVTHAENMRRGAKAMRSHCPQGHEYSDENTRYSRTGRFCRACHRASERYRREMRVGRYAGDRIEPAGAPTTATKADPHPTSAAQAAPSSPLPLQSATE